jgi:hypothetical protein
MYVRVFMCVSSSGVQCASAFATNPLLGAVEGLSACHIEHYHKRMHPAETTLHHRFIAAVSGGIVDLQSARASLGR